MQSKPNILMIQADQLSPQILKAFDPDGQAKTPHIDELAKQSVVFTNAYCNNPVCAPSRACLYSGLLASNSEAYGNEAEFKASIPTFMHFMRMAGYRTVLSGKAHFVGPDQLHGYEKRLTTDIYPSDFQWFSDWTKPVAVGPGTSVEKFNVPAEIQTNGQMLYDQEVQFRALEYLRYERIEPKDSPFFFHVSYTQPHEPFQIPQKYLDMYSDEAVGMPDSWPLEKHHIYNQWLQKHHGILDFPLTDETILSARRAHLAMTTYLDELIGDLINELKALDLYENTIIMFLSDHGEMMGEKGMWFKRTFYDRSVKTPLLISWPKKYKPGIREQVVSQVDIAPTIAEIVGFEDQDYLENYIDGKSLCGLLDDDTADWKNYAVTEYITNGVMEPMLLAREERYKYVYVHNQQPLLFDLEADPEELNNLVDNPELKELRQRLHQIATGGNDVEELKKKIMLEQRRRNLVQKAMRCGETPCWEYQPFFDAAKQYIRGVNLTPYY